MAAFPSREREAFMTHWANRILGNPLASSHTVLVAGEVAGYVGAWTEPDAGERQVCYWLGRAYWGQGIATAAIAHLLKTETVRPLHAHVVRHNAGSIRVLEKNGFLKIGAEEFSPPDGSRIEEYHYRLP